MHMIMLLFCLAFGVGESEALTRISDLVIYLGCLHECTKSLNRLFDCLVNFGICNHADQPDLISHTLQYASYLIISLDEPKLGVFDALFVCKLLSEFASLPKVVSWQAGKEMMGDLQI